MYKAGIKRGIFLSNSHGFIRAVCCRTKAFSAVVVLVVYYCSKSELKKASVCALLLLHNVLLHFKKERGLLSLFCLPIIGFCWQLLYLILF